MYLAVKYLGCQILGRGVHEHKHMPKSMKNRVVNNNPSSESETFAILYLIFFAFSLALPPFDSIDVMMA
jgi:hypothetical protein